MTLEALLTALATFAGLAIVFGALERYWPARAGQRHLRPELAVDACFFFGQYLLWSALATGALGFAHRHLAAHLPGGLRAVAAATPLLVKVVAAIALGDLLVYAFHRACHRFDFLWRFHAVHHSAEHLDWLAAHREHPVDGFLTQLCQNLPAFVIGLHMPAVAALIVLRGFWGILIHSNVRIPLGPLRMLLGAPELHHWHHARGRTEHNFANLAPWLDALFGTYHRPEGEERYALGLTDPYPRGYLAQLLQPFLPARARSMRSARTEPGAMAASAE
jgi:sterol desaturase/sphingolipid hydroxylase (fatty acid hydroxylase superfamily)